jgi:ligand-binding SRPBCC domain-containing protein
LDDAWQFFSSPHNLPLIAPTEMDFRIVSNLQNDKIYEGLKIDYTVRPLFHIKLNWKSEIREYRSHHSFIDFQLKGPYRFWRHYHEFIPFNNGVLMRDVLKYEIPFGIIGDFINWILIRRTLNYIFDYRKGVICLLFDHR